jgi:nitroreductase family protein
MPVNRALTNERLMRRLLESTTGNIEPRHIDNSRTERARDLCKLPAPLKSNCSPEAAFARRTAARSFGAKTIPSAALAAILAAAHHRVGRSFPAGREMPIELALLAWRVSDIPPALYRYDGTAHGLALQGPAPSAAEAATMLRQEEFACAATLVLALGDLESALARYGDHGYRLMLLEAGAALQRAWLAAVCVDLVGCLFEGLFPRPLSMLAGPVVADHSPLLALAVGFAPNNEAVVTVDGAHEPGTQGC